MFSFLHKLIIFFNKLNISYCALAYLLKLFVNSKTVCLVNRLVSVYNAVCLKTVNRKEKP